MVAAALMLAAAFSSPEALRLRWGAAAVTAAAGGAAERDSACTSFKCSWLSCTQACISNASPILTAEGEVNGKRRRENDIKFELWFLIGARFCHRELTGSALKQRFRLIQRQACALGVDDEDTLSNLRSISTDDSSFSAQFKEWQV